MRLMIVDDSSTMRKILKKTILQTQGIDDVVEAEDGIDALQKLKEHNCEFDLVMLDINMPRVDGLTTLKQMKSMEDTKGIPVIMCTSEAEKETVVECIKSGAADYVVKPFNKETIAAKIEKFK